MKIKKAILKGFNSTDYQATIQLTGSYQAYLVGITVAGNLSAPLMSPGKKIAVVFFDEHNPKEAVVIAVYD